MSRADVWYHVCMHLIIEHKNRRPYAHTLYWNGTDRGSRDIVDRWMNGHLTGDNSDDDYTFIITPDPADAKSAGFEMNIGNLELMRIDEIRSILIMENEV